jgi:hypothetical protein
VSDFWRLTRNSCVVAKVDVVGSDKKKTQHAGGAFDVNSSLIYIEATGGSAQVLQLVAKRIRRLVRFSDNVLLLESVCALLLPTTPFSGAQALANQISLLLIDVPCELQVYHGMTALLVLQRLREAGAKTPSPDDCAEIPAPFPLIERQIGQEEKKATSTDALPYLPFLANYPSFQVLHLFPFELACRYQCVPLGSERNMLTLGTCHGLNQEIVKQLRLATRRGLFLVRCEIAVIDEVLRYWRRLRETNELDNAELLTDEACSSLR